MTLVTHSRIELVVRRGSDVQGSNPGFKGVLLLSVFIYLASMKGSLQGHVR